MSRLFVLTTAHQTRFYNILVPNPNKSSRRLQAHLHKRKQQLVGAYLQVNALNFFKQYPEPSRHNFLDHHFRRNRLSCQYCENTVSSKR